MILDAEIEIMPVSQIINSASSACLDLSFFSVVDVSYCYKFSNLSKFCLIFAFLTVDIYCPLIRSLLWLRLYQRNNI